MEWTAEKPDKSGWYWYRHDRNPEPQIGYLNDKGTWQCPKYFLQIRNYGGEWAGPIPEPTERTED